MWDPSSTLVFRAQPLLLGPPGSFCRASLHFLGASWLLTGLGPLFCCLPILPALMVIPLENPWDPRPRAGWQGWLYREECCPHPPALPRLMPEVLLLSFTSIHGSGVATLCQESACKQEVCFPTADRHPLAHIFKMYLLKKTLDLTTHVCGKRTWPSPRREEAAETAVWFLSTVATPLNLQLCNR